MAFSLKAVFGIDSTGVRAEIKQLRRELNSFVGDYAKLGAGVAIGAFVALSKGAIDLGSKLSDLSMQLGINVEKLQVLNAIGRDAGVAQETIAKSIVKVRTSAQEAAEGNKTYADAFATLNLNTREFLALPAEQRLIAIGKAYQQTTDKNAAYNAIAAIFGEKVGPKMMEVLGTLSGQSFPALEASARAAGDVMSAETIVALDKAGDAIEAFKQRITMAIGNIIVNFRTEEGIKLMGLQLLRAAGVFGARIFDAIIESGRMTGAVFIGIFTSVSAKFRNLMVDALTGLAVQLNRFLPDKMAIDIVGLQNLKIAGESVADAITRAIADTKPSTFTKDVAVYWDGLIKQQQSVVDSLNRVEFKSAADTLRRSGEEITASGKAAGAAIADGADAAAKTLAEAAQKFNDATEAFARDTNSTFNKWTGSIKSAAAYMLNAINGATMANLEDGALKEIIRRNKEKIARVNNPALNPGAGGIGAAYETANYQTELGNAQRELDLRNRFRSDISRVGVDRARQNYDPLIFDNLLRQLNPGEGIEKNTAVLEQVRDELRRGITVRPVTTRSV